MKAVSTKYIDQLAVMGVALTMAEPGMPLTQDVLPAGCSQSMVGEVRLIPDWQSLRLIPWCNHARVMAYAYREPRPDLPIKWAMDPRIILDKMIGDLKREFGVTLKASFEEEFHLLKGNDEQGWHPVDASTFASVDSFNRSEEVISDACKYLEEQRVDVEMIHAESGAGQFEIVWRYEDILTACDNHMIAKETIQMAARKHGMKATFVPKLSPQVTTIFLCLFFSPFGFFSFNCSPLDQGVT